MSKQIVILGAGFGGMYTALNLERLWRADTSVDVTLVSRDNYFLMTPLLFEAGSGVLEPRHSVAPIRAMLRRTRFIEAEVEAIDFERKVVAARHSPEQPPYELPYDHLVLALGGVTNRQLIPGSEHALSFKILADAIYLRNHVIDLFERADAEGDPQRQRELLTFVVIGAGLVGIELVGELTEFLKNLRRLYPRVKPSMIQVHVIEAADRILKEMDPELAAYAAQALRRRGVEIVCQTAVERIQPGIVTLPGGRELRGQTIILAAGVTPSPLVSQLPLTRDGKGRVKVDATMRSVDRADVWALGDCAAIPDPNGRPYPPLAQHALREARVLARNITAALQGGRPEAFVYQTLGMLAALGHYRGVGRVWRVRIRGFFAWWVWRTYYLFQMPRWDRRLRIMLDWTVALLFRNDVVKLDLFGEQHPFRTVPHGESIRPRERAPAAPAPPVPA